MFSPPTEKTSIGVVLINRPLTPEFCLFFKEYFPVCVCVCSILSPPLRPGRNDLNGEEPYISPQRGQNPTIRLHLHLGGDNSHSER